MTQLRVFYHDARQPPINHLTERCGGDGVYVFLFKTETGNNFSCTYKVVKANATTEEKRNQPAPLLEQLEQIGRMAQHLPIKAICLHENNLTHLREQAKKLKQGLLLTITAFERR